MENGAFAPDGANASFSISFSKSFKSINLIFHLNEREEFMQETQHTQQTATRTAQNQDKKTT